jgi:hypothetical protein
MAVEVTTIDYVERYIETADERRWPISDLFDKSGLSTRDPADAVLCLAGEPGSWISIRLAAFEKRMLQ